MSDFYAIANTLLNERSLLIDGEEHFICELEIYMYAEDHPDNYTHKHPEQLSQGTFYFHRAGLKKDANFKGGTYKGVDICFGQEDIYCGILIRSIMTADGKLITGPCKVVEYILTCYDADSIADLVGEEECLSFLENKHDLLLTETKSRKNTLYSGPRIGLSDKYPDWRDKQYRFTSINKGIKSCTQLQVTTS